VIGFIGTSITITANYNSSQLLTVLRLAPLLTGLPMSSLPLWRMPNDESLMNKFRWASRVESSRVLVLRPTVSRPVYLAIRHTYGAYDQILLLSVSCGFVDVGRSHTRTGLSFTIAADPRQRSNSRIRVPPLCIVSHLRLPILSSPMTRRATVEVFNPASTGDEPSSSAERSHVSSVYNVGRSEHRPPPRTVRVLAHCSGNAC
jgi:hypothetical protein